MSAPRLTWEGKARALALRFYDGFAWAPTAGDFYTSTRADLELYQVVEVTPDEVMTRYARIGEQVGFESVTAWDRAGFTTEGFGVRRVYVPPECLGDADATP